MQPLHKPLVGVPNVYSKGLPLTYFATGPDNDGLCGFIQQAFLSTQEGLVVLTYMYRRSVPPPQSRDMIAIALRRISDAIRVLLPIFLAYIDELGTRCPNDDKLMFNLHIYYHLNIDRGTKTDYMTLLANATAATYRDATEETSFFGIEALHKGGALVQESPDVHRALIKLNAIARQLEELPVRIRMLYSELRNINDPSLYAQLQTYLLYQSAPVYKNAFVPVPIASAYLAGMCTCIANDLGALRYDETAERATYRSA